MMKNKFLTLSFATIMISAIITSCSNDNEELPKPMNTRKLISMTVQKYSSWMNSNSIYKVSDIKYDDKNRIISYRNERVDYNSSEIISIKYLDDKIIVNDDPQIYYKLDNGLISNYNEGDNYYQSFSYKGNKLIQMNHVDWMGTGNYNIDWSDNRVTRLVYEDKTQKNTMSYEYTAIKCVTPIIYGLQKRATPFDDLPNSNLDAILLASGYYGHIMMPYLLKKTTETYSDGRIYYIDFEYEIDEMNYVKKMTVNLIGENERETTNAEFVWE